MNDDDLDEYELRERLTQARNSYQRLYNQHQQELAAIAQWQTRMKAANEQNTAKLAAIATVLDSDESEYWQNTRIAQILEGK